MTFSPPDLIAVQRDVHAIVRIPWNSLGIKGDAEHAGGGTSYHLGADQLRRDAYSRTESPRDRHPTNAASAFDLGDGWQLGLGGDRDADDLAQKAFLRFNELYVAALNARVPGTEDIREIIYTTDGTEIKRADVLGIRQGGSIKHRHHTHTSFFRDSQGRRDGSYRTLLLSLIRQAISEQEGFMANVSQQDWEALIWRVEGLAAGRATAIGGPTQGQAIGLIVQLTAVQQKLESLSRAITAVGPEVAQRVRDEFAKIDEEQTNTLNAGQRPVTGVSLQSALQDLLGQLDSGTMTSDQAIDHMRTLLASPPVPDPTG
jgi:hypothetical protein